ncbi:MAG: cellulase family glycosylhydrolase [Phycisphaerae bacterium]
MTTQDDRPQDKLGGRWSAETAWRWYRERPRPFGCNFTPSTAVNEIEMWQDETFDAETIERELSWAGGLGFNSVRVFLHFLVWRHDAEGLKQRMDWFLTQAQRAGISVMFVPFDDCWGQDIHLGRQEPPVAGVHNSRWVSSPGHALVADPSARPELLQYVSDIIEAFADDDRVLAWDLYNEPGNGKPADNRPAAEPLGEKSLSLLADAFDCARRVGASQPLTAGVWNYTEKFRRLNEFQLSASDIVTFHHYSPPDETRRCIEQLRGRSRPIVCTEWMARTAGSRFQTHLPMFDELDVGCYCWGLVAGKTQTYYPWGSKPGAPEPEVWFHEVLHGDGTPYDGEEAEAIRRFAESCRRQR